MKLLGSFMDPPLVFEGGWELNICVDDLNDPHRQKQYLRLSRDDGTIDIVESDIFVKGMTDPIEIATYKTIDSNPYSHLKVNGSYYVPIAALKAFVLQYEDMYGEIEL